MPETRQPRRIASAYCTQYQTNAEFFIQDQHPSGLRHLVVPHEEGGYDDRPSFAVGIPADWTEKDVLDLLLPMKDPNREYPAWEIPSRAYGSPMLFRWWDGEKPE